jgi:hypothetical protein
VFFMFHVKFVHYMLKKRQLARRPLMCPRLFKSDPKINYRNSLELGYGPKAIFHRRPQAKLRLEVLYKKFHPRINLTTLFFTKTYLLKPFSDLEN